MALPNTSIVAGQPFWTLSSRLVALAHDPETLALDPRQVLISGDNGIQYVMSMADNQVVTPVTQAERTAFMRVSESIFCPILFPTFRRLPSPYSPYSPVCGPNPPCSIAAYCRQASEPCKCVVGVCVAPPGPQLGRHACCHLPSILCLHVQRDEGVIITYTHFQAHCDCTQKWGLLSVPERRQAFTIELKTLMANAAQQIGCVGCRRSVEAFVHKLAESDQRAFSVSNELLFGD